MRLYGVPEAISAGICQFDTPRGAVQTVILAMQHGIPVARIELLDDVQMEACIRYSKLEGFAAKPTLLFEFHGSEAGVAEQAAQMQAITEEFGGSAFEWATKPEDRSRLWKARHAAYYAAKAMYRRASRCSRPTRACRSRALPTACWRPRPTPMRRASSPRSSAMSATATSTSACCSIPTIAGERARAEELAKRISLRAIAMGGTCTGEHGVGVHKLDALVAEHGEAVDLMRTIKRALDPLNIMNPGKTVPL